MVWRALHLGGWANHSLLYYPDEAERIILEPDEEWRSPVSPCKACQGKHVPHACARLPGNGPIAARRRALLQASKAEAEAAPEAEPERKAHTTVCKACQGKHVAHTCARLPGNGPLAARRRALLQASKAKAEAAPETEAERHTTVCKACLGKHVAHTCARLPGNGPLAARRCAFEAEQKVINPTSTHLAASTMAEADNEMEEQEMVDDGMAGDDEMVGAEEEAMHSESSIVLADAAGLAAAASLSSGKRRQTRQSDRKFTLVLIFVDTDQRITQLVDPDRPMSLTTAVSRGMEALSIAKTSTTVGDQFVACLDGDRCSMDSIITQTASREWRGLGDGVRDLTDVSVDVDELSVLEIDVFERGCGIASPSGAERRSFRRSSTSPSTNAPSTSEYGSAPSAFIDRELTASENQAITRALARGNGSEILSDYRNVPVTRRDMGTLKPCMWLNDEVINLYFELLADAYPTILFLKTNFYTKLMDGWRNKYTYKNVRRWTKKVDVFSKVHTRMCAVGQRRLMSFQRCMA